VNTNETATFNQYGPLLISLARRFARRYACDVDDAIQNGGMGLLTAIRTFDEARGVPFTAWARQRIAFALIDGLRRERVQASRRKGNGAVTFIEIDQPTRDNAMGDSQLAPLHERMREFSVAPDVDDGNGRSELRAAIAELPDTWRHVIELYYFADMEQADIAREMFLSPSRVSQLLNQARNRLRETLTGGGGRARHRAA
jgi:RNA polymerase sigma factor for flagellar operon FliA